MTKWMYYLRFYVPLNSISFILGLWIDDDERLCAMTPRLRLNRFPPPASLEPGTARPAGKRCTELQGSVRRNSRECSIRDSGYTVTCSSRSHVLVMVIVVVRPSQYLFREYAHVNKGLSERGFYVPSTQK